MTRPFIILFCYLSFSSLVGHGQQDTTRIEILAETEIGEMKPIYAYFGYDEPNYTYRENGQKLLSEIAALSPVPVYVRTHNLLTTQEGQPDLKWGFTNAYTEDRKGRPIYNWTVVDQILDSYVSRGMKPLVELGFMPKALSSNPEPYQHEWSAQGAFWTGWTYPPTDYDKWAELIYQLVLHEKEKYGSEEIESWLWEPWNEPDIGYWSGTFEEFCKLYDYTAEAVKRACPKCTFGGPHTTGPAGKSGNVFLRDFLEHAVNGTNYKTGQKGSTLEYLSFHAKGQPKMVDGHIRMNMGIQLKDIHDGFDIIKDFPELSGLPIIIGECDPEGCAACSWKRDPKYGYRNGTVYPSYTAASFARIYDLMDQKEVNLQGALTWAFEFEDQEWFAGFRELASNGVDKPVMNVFRMFGMMSGQRVKTQSPNSYSALDIIANGVLESPDIHAMATKSENMLSILVWNYHDDDILGAINSVELSIKGLNIDRTLMRHYRVDQDLSNSYTEWEAQGKPQNPTKEQFQAIEKAGQLKLLTSPQWISGSQGEIILNFELPRQGVSLIQLEL